MEELKQILITHAERYPLMEPTDGVKLIYQNEFGGGHMIRDEAACLAYLRQEYDSIRKDPDMPPEEPIGNRIVRVHLAAVKPEKLEQLGADFIRSANEHAGSLEKFLEKLDVLRCLAAQGHFAFDGEALEAYLASYRETGYPPVSHSQVYRQAYHPAYRIIRK